MATRRPQSAGNRNRSGRGGSRRGKRRGGGGAGKLLIALVLIFAVLAAGWYFGTPYWTLYQMRDAVKNRDSEALAGYIDEPALRDNLRTQMEAKLSAVADKEKGLGALGAILAGAAVGPLADRMVSRDGLRGLVEGLSINGASAKPTALQTRHPEVAHEGLSGFRVHDPKRATGDGDLIFRREGIGWKLVGVQLPGTTEARDEAAE